MHTVVTSGGESTSRNANKKERIHEVAGGLIINF